MTVLTAISRARDLLSSLALLLSTAGAVRAHGGPPTAFGIAATSTTGPTLVVLNEGLAQLQDERWSYLCPRLWGDAATSAGKLPLARSVDGTESWIIGEDDLYAARSGVLTPQNRPDLSRNRVLQLAGDDRALYGLRIAANGGSEVVAIGPSELPPLWASAQYFSAIAIDRDHIYLGGLVNDLEVVFLTLDRHGTSTAESRLITDHRSARVQLQPTDQRLYAVTYDGRESTLHALEASRWSRVIAGQGVMEGPQASPGGRLWLALDGELMRYAGASFEPVGETRGVTCLGQVDSRPYACVGGDIHWLTDDGLGERIFTLEGFSAPDPAQVPPAAARECEFQWVLFRNDLMMAGLSTRGGVAGAVGAQAAGSQGAQASAGAAGEAPAAGGGGNVAPDAPRSGCSVARGGVIPDETRGHAAWWLTGLVLFTLRPWSRSRPIQGRQRS